MPKVDTLRSMIYIGIDPGKQGGIAVIDGDDVECIEMPSTEGDLWDEIKVLRSCPEFTPVACIEHVTTSPQMGVTSAGTFMYGYGGLRMALLAAEIPHQTVRPQVWQKGLKIPPRKKTEKTNQWKDRLRSEARRLYPKLNIWCAGLGAQRAVSDAILLAHYCRLLTERRL